MRSSRALLFLSVAAAGCGSPKAPEQPDRREPIADGIVLGTGDVAIATMASLAAGITVTGSLDPAAQVEVRAQLPGQVIRVLVERGAAVRAGQPLATYDAATLQAQAVSASATLSARIRDFGAADTLYRAGVLAHRDFEQAKVARDAAAAEVARSQEAVGRATLRAPIAGQISEKLVSAGEAVQPGMKLFTVVNNDVLELVGQVGADQIGLVRVGQPVSLRLEAYGDRALRGRVARIEPVADQATRQVGVVVRVPNPDHGIVAGLFATGTILSDGAGDAPVLVVPSAALRHDSAGPAVLAVVGDRIERRAVTVGLHDEQAGLIEIRTGLAAGDKVIIAPGADFTAGALVRTRLAAVTAGSN